METTKQIQKMAKDAIVDFHLAKVHNLLDTQEKYIMMTEGASPILGVLLQTEIEAIGNEIDKTYEIVKKTRGF